MHLPKECDVFDPVHTAEVIDALDEQLSHARMCLRDITANVIRYQLQAPREVDATADPMGQYNRLLRLKEDSHDIALRLRRLAKWLALAERYMVCCICGVRVRLGEVNHE